MHVDAEQVADPWSLVRAFDLALTDLETVTAAREAGGGRLGDIVPR